MFSGGTFCHSRNFNVVTPPFRWCRVHNDNADTHSSACRTCKSHLLHDNGMLPAMTTTQLLRTFMYWSYMCENATTFLYGICGLHKAFMFYRTHLPRWNEFIDNNICATINLPFGPNEKLCDTYAESELSWSVIESIVHNIAFASHDAKP